MNLRLQDEPATVSTGMLRRYLTAHGWHSSAAAESHPLPSAVSRGRAFELFVLSEPGFDKLELLLPTDPSMKEYHRRVREVIQTLADLEDRSISEVVLSVRSVVFDVVRSRIPNEHVIEDSIHLDSATSYINGMKWLLASAATTELRRLRFYGRLNKDAVLYADRCRFGHTYRGSFGFTIESPITPNTQQPLEGIQSPPPFERRVVQRLATGIKRVCDAEAAGDLAPVVNGFSAGLSANGCEQLADLVEETAVSGISFSFSFSEEWPVASDLAPEIEYWLGPSHVEVSRAAAKAMRSNDAESPVRVYGLVVRLQNQTDPSDVADRTGEHEVVIQWGSEDYGDILVKVVLPPAQYLSAIAAHASGRPVQVSGLLTHKGRRWFLSNPVDFSVSQQSSLDF